MKNTRAKHSLLTMIIGVTLVVLMLVFVLLFSIAQQSTTNLEEYILSRRSAEALSASRLINQDVEALYTRLYAELTDASLTKIRLYMESGMYQSGYYDLTKMINSRLAVFERSQNLAQNVEIYLPKQQHVINSSAVLRMTREQQEKLMRICEAEKQRVALVDDELVFVVNRHTGNADNRVFALTRLTRVAMARYLKEFSVSDMGQVALFVKTGEEIVYFTALDDALDVQVQAQIASAIGDAETGETQILLGKDRSLITWVRVGTTPLLLCCMIPMEMIDSQLTQFRTSIMLVLVVVVLLMTGLIAFLYSVMLKPQKRLRQAFQMVENGELSTRIEQSVFEEYDQMYAGFNHMAGRLQHLIEREYELNLLNVKAQIKEMRYQINPHFLYNTYFNLRAMLIDEDYEQAAQLAELLGRYLHYITASTQEEATLREELEHSIAYMNIQQMRFGRRVRTQVEQWPEADLQMKVPRLILQPLIENAYGHGMKNVESGGLIAIRFEREKNRLSVFVEDNGSGVTDELIARTDELIASPADPVGTDGLALRNIHRRLALLYAPGSGLYVSRSPLGGFRSEIRIMEEDADVSGADC